MKARAAELACPRLFEVEALRDGRLTGTEVTRFQSHARTCPICAQEMQSITELAEALRSTATPPKADELRVRRERTRLLAAFDASLAPIPGSSRTKLWLAAVAALTVVAMLAWRLRPSRTAAPVVASPNSVQVQAATTTKWSRRAENQLETITLEAGTLSIRVDHQRPHRRLLVMLPDGELEDVGTTFSVSAAAAHTTQVTVQDGSVILRLRDLPALTLRAGDSWSPARAPAPDTAASVLVPPQPPLPSVHSANPARASVPSSSNAAAPAGNNSDSATDFRAAMSAFTSGDNTRASSLFAAFLGQHPRDSHAEDAAYLRVLTLQRAGNAGDMKQAATEYLARYPHGFRYAEVEPLSH